MRRKSEQAKIVMTLLKHHITRSEIV